MQLRVGAQLRRWRTLIRKLAQRGTAQVGIAAGAGAGAQVLSLSGAPSFVYDEALTSSAAVERMFSSAGDILASNFEKIISSVATLSCRGTKKNIN